MMLGPLINWDSLEVNRGRCQNAESEILTAPDRNLNRELHFAQADANAYSGLLKRSPLFSVSDAVCSFQIRDMQSQDFNLRDRNSKYWMGLSDYFQ